MPFTNKYNISLKVQHFCTLKSRKSALISLDAGVAEVVSCRPSATYDNSCNKYGKILLAGLKLRSKIIDKNKML